MHRGGPVIDSKSARLPTLIAPTVSAAIGQQQGHEAEPAGCRDRRLERGIGDQGFALDSPLEGDGFELPVREHRAMAPSHGFAAASHREAALGGARPRAMSRPRSEAQRGCVRPRRPAVHPSRNAVFRRRAGRPLSGREARRRAVRPLRPCTPTGSRNVRVAPAGRSLTRRGGEMPTLAGSNSSRSAHAPVAIRPPSGMP